VPPPSTSTQAWFLSQVNVSELQHAVIAQPAPAGVHSWQIWSAPHSSGEQHRPSAQLTPVPAHWLLHVPATHAVPSGQTLPHPPQFSLSTCSSTHWTLQQVSPTPHDAPSGASAVPHVPSVQVAI